MIPSRWPLALTLCAVLAACGQAVPEWPDANPGIDSSTPEGFAMGYLSALSDGIGSRPIGTLRRDEARDYIVGILSGLASAGGANAYAVGTEAFSYGSYSGFNIIASDPGFDPADPWVLVSAHYDSVGIGRGADDNGSGVAVALSMARSLAAEGGLAKTQTVFAYFDGEENGLWGAYAWVASHGEAMLPTLRLHINIDSLYAGDYLYAHRGEYDSDDDRLALLALASARSLELRTQDGLRDDGSSSGYPEGTVRDAGDYQALYDASPRKPFINIEATNWDLGDSDGYQQTHSGAGESGRIWHTRYDDIDYVELLHPGRGKARAKALIPTLIAFLQSLLP
jgi:hypothetical protein